MSVAIEALEGRVLLSAAHPLSTAGSPLHGSTHQNINKPAKVGLTTSPAPSVANEYLFYFGSSAFDNSATAPSSADQNAIATDKSALLANGSTATFANISSYANGINGILIDFANLPTGVTFSASDFQFNVGNNNTPSSWVTAPAPTAVATWTGSNGDTFADIVWANKAISDEWLQVTVLADANTHLTNNFTFYYGSEIGATGISTATTGNGPVIRVTSADVVATQNNASLLQSVPITNLYDFNRDGKVTAADIVLCQNNTTLLGGLVLISPSIGGVLTTDQDIGSPASAGSYSYVNGTYTVSGGGAGISGGSDQFNLASTSLTGDGTVVAHITSISSASALAGVMIRNDSSADSACAALLVDPGTGLLFVIRPNDGGVTGQTTESGFNAPLWVKLTLSVGQVSAFFSSDGINWTQFGSTQPITFGPTTLAGLAVSANNNAASSTATFTNVSVLPANWSDNDLGSPPLPGGAGFSEAADSYTLFGSGSGIGNTSDQINFADASLTGGGSVVALVDSLAGGGTSAQAGVMIRNDSTAGSAFASLNVTTQNYVSFAWRAADGGTENSVTVSAPNAPLWVELIQSGSSITAYESTNGVNWTQIGTAQTVSMTSSISLAGLDVSSNGTNLSQATFLDVSALQGGWTDGDIGSPAVGGAAVYDSPSDTYTISGSGSDIFGTSDQFNFASTTMTGNGSVIAYVDSITDTNASAKAGVMLRNDNTPGSAFAALFVSATNGIIFEWRSTAGGITSESMDTSIGSPVMAPVGLELIRSGSSFTAFRSTDGINWYQVGSSETVTMSNTALAGLAVTAHNNGAICTATFSSVGIGSSPPPGAGVYSTADELFLNDLEYREFLFFWDETNPNTGLSPDNASASGGSPSESSIASVGFDLTALTIGAQRGWVSTAAAYSRALTTLDFLYNTAAQVNGFFYHFLDPTTGQRYGTSEVSSVDTAELMAGVLTAGQYWAGTSVQTVALQLYDRVDWPWMQETNGQFYRQWTPEHGFQNSYGDFSEAALLYLLALGSPTYPVSAASWDSWSRSPVENYDGYKFVEADDAALFTEQYPQAWFNLRGMADNTNLNFYQNSQIATLAQRQMFIDLSSKYSDYGPNFWGITPSEGPSGYTVWGGPPASSNIDGTVVPTAPGGSLEFEPRYALNDLENMKQLYGSTVYRKYGFVDAFNPLTGWTSSLVLGIDVGMTLVAAENSRSNFVWDIFMQNPAAQTAIAEAGFHLV